MRERKEQERDEDGEDPRGSGEGEAGLYRIGSVSDLTGIPPHTLRAWERRYGASDPARTGAGFRLYSEEDVGRLTLIKRLSDLGHAIGSIANLSMKELQERLARVEERGWRGGQLVRSPSAPGNEGPVPLIVLDPGLEAQIREAGGEACGLAVLGSASTVPELWAVLEALEDRGPVVLAVALGRLGDAPARTLRELREERSVLDILILHDFVPRRLLRQVALSGGRLVQGRPAVDALRRIAREAAAAARLRRLADGAVEREAPATNGNGGREEDDAGGDRTNPPRLFSDPELGRLREVESAVDCECPNHLSQILSGLLAFEEYASACENRDPRDAALHSHLYRETGRARAIMERALLHLCREEGIEL